VKAILARPEISLPGRYVEVSKGNISLGGALKAWSNATGNDAAFIQCSMEDYKKLFGVFGEELACHFVWSSESENSWGPPDTVTIEDLGVEDFIGFEEALREIFASGVALSK